MNFSRMGYVGFIFVIMCFQHLYFMPDFFDKINNIDQMLWFHQLWFYQGMSIVLFIADTFYTKLNK